MKCSKFGSQIEQPANGGDLRPTKDGAFEVLFP
jgi:hypothetical protein